MSDVATASPEALIVAALAARDAWRYEAVAALVDPASAGEMFRAYCEQVRPKTLDDFRGYHPDLAEDELARWYAHWMEQTHHTRDSIERAVPGVRSHEELLRLDPLDYLARRLRRADSRADVVERLRARGRDVPAFMLDTPPGVRYAALGHVAEAPDLAHVLYRERYEGATAQYVDRGPVEMESCRRQPDGSWRLLADWHMLQPHGGTANILPPEWADLWDDAPEPGAGAPPDAPR